MSKMIKAIEFMPEPVQGKARNAYEELILEGMEKGMEKGIEKGIEKEKIRTAINLFKLGADLDFIARVTELDQETLQRIIREAE